MYFPSSFQEFSKAVREQDAVVTVRGLRVQRMVSASVTELAIGSTSLLELLLVQQMEQRYSPLSL